MTFHPYRDYTPVMAVLLERAGGTITITDQELVHVDANQIISITEDLMKRTYTITLHPADIQGEVIPDQPLEIARPEPDPNRYYEELADIVDDTERVRVVLAARRGKATPSAVGTIVTWSQGTVPAGWLLCDGAPIDPAQYPQLAALLDSDNRTPDLRRPGYHNKIIYAGEQADG